MNKPLVSVIVTTKNEEDVIGRLLQSIKSQSYSDIELIVVDNNSQDKTRSIAEKFTKKIFNKGPERSAQRNYGAEVSRGKYLLFLDADMELSSKVVEESVEIILSNKEIGAITIPEESVANTFWEKVKAFERSFYNLEGDVTTDAARFFPKTVFNIFKGYDEKLTGPEDWDLTDRLRRAKYKIGRISSLIYHHERIKSIYSLVKKKYFYGLKSNVYLKKQKISPFSAKTIYLFRPVFYKNWQRMLLHPVLTTAMFFMFSLEIASGGMGYLVGKARKG